MNLLAQNKPRQFVPGRVVIRLHDDLGAEHLREWQRLNRFQQWYAKNRERVITKTRNHHAANRDAINAKRRERYAADPEKYRQAAQAAYVRHADKIKARVMARAKRLRGE